jgi:hypothetical protein
MGRKPKEPSNTPEDLELDPILEGLLLRLPRAGEYWPAQERQQWLTLLQGALAVIYNDKPPEHQHPASA